MTTSCQPAQHVDAGESNASVLGYYQTIEFDQYEVGRARIVWRACLPGESCRWRPRLEGQRD